MKDRGSTAFTAPRRRNRLASTRLNTRLDLIAMVIAALSIDIIVTGSLALACPWCLEFPARKASPLSFRISAAEAIEEDWDEVEEVCHYESVLSEDVIAEPIIDSEQVPVLSDTVGLDAEMAYLPFEESLGSDGISDTSFRGPANTGLLGLGGGAGGAFGGRGGSRDLGGGGGGRNSRCDGCWQRSDLVPHQSRVTVGDKEELSLEGMHVRAHVEGFRARVVVDCLYRNDRGRDLEGRFQIRLPNEASPHYFAFGEVVRVGAPPATSPRDLAPTSRESIRASQAGTWTEPKEARIVPRARAARAYAEVSRKRIDPALLEWAGPDIFSARVSPLAAGTLHRIVLAYDVNLASTPCALSYALDLPKAIANLSVDLHVANRGAVVHPARPSTHGWYQYSNTRERRFRVCVPNPGSVMVRGRDPEAGDFFGVRFRPLLPAESTASASRAVFLLDTSASSSPVRFNIWLALLESILERNRSTLEEFAVLFFDVDAGWWREGFVPNTEATVRALLHDCERLVLEGATNLQAALGQASTQPGAYDVFLLSDGAATWGETDTCALERALGTERALFAYRTGISGTATAELRALARATGGAVFSVTSEAEVETAATAHTMRPWRIDALSIPGGHDLLLEGRPRTLYPGQELLLVGRGRPEGGLTVALTVSRGAEQRRVQTGVRMVYESTLASRIYGQVAVGQLEMVDASGDDLPRAYATHFRVVGDTCSLLMLESEADYRRYGIDEQDDASVVRAREADPFIRAALDAERDAGPKARFLDLLSSVEEAVGGDSPSPAPIEALLGDVPESAFRIPVASLGRRAVDPIPTTRAYLAELPGDELDYETIWRHADALAGAGAKGAALRALSSLIERSPGKPALLRDVGFQAQAWGFGGHAYHLLGRAALLRPHQSQGLADVADCLADAGRPDAAALWYEAALSRLSGIDSRSSRRCVLFAYAHLLDGIARGTRKAHLAGHAESRLAEIRTQLGMDKADLVVTIAWNTDRTDVDLHVLEPTGEECYYQHPKTKLGGRITRDVTTGFGPETYVLPGAPEGTYGISVKYFSSDSLRTSMRTRARATVHRHWGTAEATMTRASLLLVAAKDTQSVAQILVEP